MNDFLVAETYSYALFNGIFFTRWVETTALITAFLFTLLSQGMLKRLCRLEKFKDNPPFAFLFQAADFNYLSVLSYTHCDIIIS